MGGKRSSGKHYTSVGKYPAIGKKTRKILRHYKETSFRSFLAKAEYLSNPKLSGLQVKKYKLENVMTKMAKTYYDQHDGNICWGRIVQAVRTGEPLDNFRATKKSRNEVPNFEIKIKLSEVQKYSELYGSLI